MENIKNIRNMENTRFVCVYDISSLIYTEKLDDNYKIKKNIGFYIKVDKNVIGVMESSNGPIFFNNKNLYYLKECNYEFKHNNLSDEKANFKLIVDDVIKEDIIYSKPIYTDYDQWSSEKDVDFFQWILQTQESEILKERFHKYYTR